MNAHWSRRAIIVVIVLVPSLLVELRRNVAQAVGQGQAQAAQVPATCPENEAAAFHACVISRTPTYQPSRTADGRPDLQGWWQSALGGTQNIEEHARTPATQPGKSLIVDPPSGLIPYQPWAAAQIKENARAYVEPNAACFPSGSPRSVYTPGGFQIRQTPGYVVMMFDRAHNYRIIPTDERPRVGIPLWQGEPRGRWEGDTLVVDIVSQNGRTWLDQQGRFGTDALHVVERFSFVDEDTLHFQATIDDPNVYTRPWIMAIPLKRDKRKPRFEFVEDACFEGDETVDMLLKLGYRVFPGIAKPR